MPTVRTDTDEPNPAGGDAIARIDTEVFEILSGQREPEPLAGRPRIDRWLSCWHTYGVS